MVASSTPRSGRSCSVARRMSRVAATLPTSNRGDADHQPPEPTVQDRAHLDAERSAGSVGESGSFADGVDDRGGGEYAGDDRQGDGPAGADGRNQGECQQRPGDRAGRCRPPVKTRRRAPYFSGRTTSARSALRAGTRIPRAAQAPRAQDADLPDAGRCADRCGQHRSGRVTADRDCAPSGRVVGKRTTGESSYPGKTVGEALDQTQARRRAPQGCWSADSAAGRSVPRGQGRRGSLVVPMPATPGVSHCGSWTGSSPSVASASGSVTGRSLPRSSLHREAGQPRPVEEARGRCFAMQDE